jgi:hypothetical protein
MDTSSPGILLRLIPTCWTTAWVLIMAGCSWEHVSLFHEKAKRRKEG